MAVDSASPGRLNALAVLAFCAGITRLPGHWSPRSSPVNATARTTPSRLTMVARMSRLNPPLDSFRAAIRADLRAAWLGSLPHSLALRPSATAVCGCILENPRISPVTSKGNRWLMMILLVGTRPGTGLQAGNGRRAVFLSGRGPALGNARIKRWALSLNGWKAAIPD